MTQETDDDAPVERAEVCRLIERARAHLRLGYSEEARDALRKALELDPENSVALEWTACVRSARLQSKGKLDDAETLLKDEIDRRPGSAGLLIQRSYLHLKKMEFQKAYDVAAEALARDGTNDVAWGLQVASLRMLTKFKEARELAERYLTDHPDNAILRYERGMIAFDQGDHAQAFADFSVADDQGYPRAGEWKIVAEADQLRVRQRYDDAQQVIVGGLANEKYSKSVHILNQLGLIYYDRRNYTAAVRTFEEALAWEAKSDFAKGWRFISESVLRRTSGDLSGADQLLERAAAFPWNPFVLTEKGWLLLHLNRIDQAVEAFEKAIHCGRTFAPGHLGLGTALARSPARREEAEAAFAQAISIKRDYAEAHAGMGIVLGLLGREREAEQSLRRALEMEDPAGPPTSAAANLARLLNEQHRPEAAFDVIEQALSCEDSWELLAIRAAVSATLADKYHDDERRRDALADVTGALKKAGPATTPEAMAFLYLLRGNGLAGLGQHSKAKRDFSHCIRLAPQSRVAMVAGRNLRRLSSEVAAATAPRWLPYFLLVVLLGLLGYMTSLIERRMLSALEALPMMTIVLLLMIAAFALPVVTRLKFGAAELEKAASALTAAPSLEVLTTVPISVDARGFLQYEQYWRSGPPA